MKNLENHYHNFKRCKNARFFALTSKGAKLIAKSSVTRYTENIQQLKNQIK
jgi:hypothetical protein